jgi:hypothetical protein
VHVLLYSALVATGAPACSPSAASTTGAVGHALELGEVADADATSTAAATQAASAAIETRGRATIPVDSNTAEGRIRPLCSGGIIP